MRKYFGIMILLIMSVTMFGQTKLSAPIGLTFGNSLESAKQILNQVGTFVEKTSRPYGISVQYSEVKIGATTADVVMCKFVNNKLFEVCVYYKADDEKIQSMYDNFCSIINTKYGKGKSFRIFRYPYKDGDEDFITAIEGGYADIETYWTHWTHEEEDDAIVVEIIKVPAIRISYQNGVLFNEAKRIEDNKNNASF